MTVADRFVVTLGLNVTIDFDCTSTLANGNATLFGSLTQLPFKKHLGFSPRIAMATAANMLKP